MALRGGHAMGSIRQSVASFDRDSLVGSYRQPFSDLRTDVDVLDYHDRTSPIEVLAARYPVVHQLVGELSFRIVARRFILSEPPSVPIPFSYGDNFPGFLRKQGTAASIEYVADIAELEMARTRARYAADARHLAGAALSPLQTRRLSGLRVVLHPSVYLVQSCFPVVTIWESSQTGGMIDRWGCEAALSHGRSLKSRSGVFHPAVMPSSVPYPRGKTWRQPRLLQGMPRLNSRCVPT
jgi:hypothetical protein